MLDKELIRSKMEMISAYLAELEPYLKFDNETIKKDSAKLRPIERLFQLIADSAIDINTHIIAEKNFRSPDDYRGTFAAIAEHNVLPRPFAEKIAPSVGLRNALIHQYEKIDTDRMLGDIKKNIGDYVEYLRFIKMFFEKDGTPN